MRKLMIVLFMLVFNLTSAQTFDFACGDANGVVTHDGFEIYGEGNVLYRSDRYPSYIIRVLTFQGTVFFRTENAETKQSRRNFGEGTYQERYDNAVADIMSVAPFIPRVNVAEGIRDLVGSVSFLTPNGVIHDLQHGSEVPEGATEFIAYDHGGSYGGDGTLLRGPVTPEENLDICFSILNITPGLVTVSDPTFVIGIAVGDARYPGGVVIPGEFSEFRILAGNNRTVGPFTNSVECGILTLDTSLDLGGVRPFQLDPVSVFAAGGDATGLYYSFAGKDWIIARNGGTYIFTSGNQRITTISLGFSGRRFTFGQYSYLFETGDDRPKVGITTNKDNTIELEGSIVLQDSNVKKFFPIGDEGGWNTREQAFFAHETPDRSTDASRLNKSIVDLTPISPIRTGLNLPVEAGKWYGRLRDGNINYFSSTTTVIAGTARDILWEINNPSDLDNGITKYVYINNQRRSANLSIHDQASGYFSVNTATYGGYGIDIGDNEARFRGDTSIGILDVVNYYVNADGNNGLAQPGLRPGDYVVMRNHPAGTDYGIGDDRSGTRGYVVIRITERRGGTIRYVPVYSYDTFDPGWRSNGRNVYVVPHAATYLGAIAIFK